MTGHEIAFVIVAAIGSIGAFRLVTSRNVVHAALYLVAALAMTGATYLLVGAEFLGWVQILIYVGAIVVLLLFALMLTKAPIGRETLDNQQRGVAAVLGLAVLAGLVYLAQDHFAGRTVRLPPGGGRPSTAVEVGTSIFTDFVLPFEAVSVLLLAALVGAVVIARKDDAPSARPELRVPERRPRIVGRRGASR